LTLLYQHDLRVRLSERRARLYRAASGPFENELALFMRWMAEQPYLAALIAELETSPITVEQWQAGGGIGWQTLEFPEDEAERAKVCLEICRAGDPRNWAHQVSTENRFADMYRDFVEIFVDPLVNFLHDRLEEGGSVLGVLERYKRRTEWFHQRELHDRYTADSTRGEAALDAHLREYLVDQGISYPFSQPRSPSGEADVVANLGGDEPLALEVKLFLPSAGKDNAYIRQGFAQAVRYASDFMLPAGYLVVFNLTKELLGFEGEGDSRWPPTVRVGDTSVFLIAVQVNPDRPTASRDPKLARHVITTEFLLDQEAGG
jgi:hypothetical protein